MTKEDIENGWWDIPAGLIIWICPSCSTGTWGTRWKALDVYCEDCGDHDGRKCPECGEVFDHVWGAEEIRKKSLNVGS